MTADMMRSDEFGIVYCYWKILGREPDPEGRRHFAEILSGKSKQDWPLSVAQIADELLRGDEFVAHRKALKTPLGEKAVAQERTRTFCHELRHFSLKMADVTFLYIKILGRWPDDAAKAHYEQAVQEQSLSVVQMALELLRSEEYNAQGPLALSKDDFIAQIAVKNSSAAVVGSDTVWVLAECCIPPENVDVGLLEATRLFLIGEHPADIIGHARINM